jgi:hypothetical protein
MRRYRLARGAFDGVTGSFGERGALFGAPGAFGAFGAFPGGVSLRNTA